MTGTKGAAAVYRDNTVPHTNNTYGTKSWDHPDHNDHNTALDIICPNVIFYFKIAAGVERDEGSL